MKALVENFQSLEDVNLDIEGFTVVLGPSNAGKSSLARAISSALFNRSGSYFVRKGTDNAVVDLRDAPTATPGRTMDIRWTKGKAPGSYVLDGDDKRPYQKVGKGTPEPVTAAGYRDVELRDTTLRPQVAAQNDTNHPGLFLLQDGGSTLVDALAAASRLDIYASAVEFCAEDLRAAAGAAKLAAKRAETVLPAVDESAVAIDLWLQGSEPLLSRAQAVAERRARIQTISLWVKRLTAARAVAAPPCLSAVPVTTLAHKVATLKRAALSSSVRPATSLPRLPETNLRAKLQALARARITVRVPVVPVPPLPADPVVFRKTVAATRRLHFAKRVPAPTSMAQAFPSTGRYLGQRELLAYERNAGVQLALRESQLLGAKNNLSSAADALTAFYAENPVCPVCGGVWAQLG